MASCDISVAGLPQYSSYEADLATGRSKLLSYGTPYTRDWVVDDQGRPIARTEWLADRKRFSVVRLDKSAKAEIFSAEVNEPPYARPLLQDGAILLVGTLGRERKALWRLPIEARGPAGVLAANEQHDVASIEYDPTRTARSARGWEASSRASSSSMRNPANDSKRCAKPSTATTRSSSAAHPTIRAHSCVYPRRTSRRPII